MSIWHITGGSPLRGQIRVQGSKNAVLPVIAASLLCGAETELLNCPNLSDVDAAMDILRYLGCTAARCGDALCIDTTAPARRRGRPSSITPPASRRSKRCKAIFARSARTYPAQARLSSGSPAFPRALTRDFASRPTGSPRQRISAARRAPAGRSSLPTPRPDRLFPCLTRFARWAAP